MDIECTVVKDGPIYEVSQVSGVALAEEVDFEGKGLLIFRMGECSEDSVTAAKPVLMPDTP